MWIYQRGISGIWGNTVYNRKNTGNVKINSYTVVYVDGYDDFGVPFVKFQVTSTLRAAYDFYVSWYKEVLC